MSVKISDLKLQKIRKTFTVIVDGQEKEIEVFNLLGEDRKEMINDFKEVSKIEDNVEESKKLFKKVYEKCTNIDFNEDLIDALNNANIDLMQVQLEIQEIVHEIQCEEMISRINEVNQVESMLYVELALKKSERVENLMTMIKDLENE